MNIEKIMDRQSVIIEGWLEKRTVNVVNLKQFRRVYVSLTREKLKYEFGEDMHNTEKDIDIKDISHVHQVGACVQFSQKCSSQRGFKVVSLQTISTYVSGKWFAAFISVGVKLPPKKRDGNFRAMSNMLSIRRHMAIPLAIAAPKPVIVSLEFARVDSLVVLECLSRTPKLLQHILRVEGRFQKVVSVSLAVFLSHQVLTKESKFGFPSEWLTMLISTEVGLGDKSTLRPYSLLLREERMTSIALSSLLRIVFQFSPLTHEVISPLLVEANQEKFNNNDDVLTACATSIHTLKQLLLQPSPEASIVRSFARCCLSVSERAVEAGHVNTPEPREAEETTQPTARAEDFLYALLSGTIFLRVLCPALVSNCAETLSLSDGNVPVAAAAVLSHILLAECDLDEIDGLPPEFFHGICSKVPLEAASDCIQSFMDDMIPSLGSGRKNGMVTAKAMQKVANAIPVPSSPNDSEVFRGVVLQLKNLFDELATSAP